MIDVNIKWIFAFIWVTLISAIDLVGNRAITVSAIVLGIIISMITLVSICCRFVPILKSICGGFIIDYTSDKILFIIYLSISLVTLIYSYLGIWSTL